MSREQLLQLAAKLSKRMQSADRRVEAVKASRGQLASTLLAVVQGVLDGCGVDVRELGDLQSVRGGVALHPLHFLDEYFVLLCLVKRCVGTRSSGHSTALLSGIARCN